MKTEEIVKALRHPLSASQHEIEAAADALDAQAGEIARLRAALERIVGMCDVPTRCSCGRPNGLGAVVACAEGALEASDAAPRLGNICMWCHKFEQDLSCDAAPHGHHTFICADTLEDEES